MKKRLSKLTRNEKGQGLVIVLALLAIGGLVITPLLAHMYTGLSSGQIYWERVPLSYAAEAGIEDGIWKADNDEKPLDLVPLDPYDYDTEYSYSLDETINDKAVDVSVKQIWPLAGLESDAYGTEPATGLRITGGIVNAVGRYEVRISYDFPEVDLLIDRVAVWLPPGFEYVTGSTEVMTTHPSIPDNPTEVDWNGGTALIWDFFAPVNFLDLPVLGAEDPLEGGFQPAVEYPTIRILRFNVTPEGEVAIGSYSWVRTTDSSLSWESGLTIYKINSTATDNTTGKSITASAYTYTSEGVDTGWIDTGGSIMSGDYRAVGNTLMQDLDQDKRRETHLEESSATISDIPAESEVAFAYLYWSGWRNYTGSMEADKTCTFKIETEGETLKPDASGNYTQCTPYGATSNYQCVDETSADEDSTYVQSAYGVDILRPDASGSHTECAPYGAASNYQCVDETSADEDSTYVQTGYAPEILRPNAAGTYSQCDPVGGYNNYQCVDEATADGDNTYVRTWYGTTELDTYNIDNHSVGSGTINSVTVYIRTRTSDGTHAVEVAIRTHGTNYFEGYTQPPTSYTDISATWTTNPYTGSPWTWDEIDALEIGLRHHDLNGGYLLTTQVYAEVSFGMADEQTTILRPNTAGDETNITYQEPSSGAHWDKVDEATADDFSTYVYTSSTSGERDLYHVSDYSDEATINRVTVYFRFSGDQVGVDDYAGYARAAIKTNGTVYLGSTESQMGKTFITKSYTWTTNPYTGSPWTWDEIAALQAGIELAGTTTTQAYCTQVYVEVGYTSTNIQIDTYNIENKSGIGVVNSVTVHVRTKGISSGDTNAAQTVIRTHNTDYFGTYTLLPTSYTDLSTTYTTNPSTGNAWNWDEVNALEAGVKHYDNGDGAVRTTQVYIVVDYGLPFGEAQMDTYNLENHSQGSGTINSVTVHIRSRGTSSADTHAIETVIRTHNTDYFGTYTLLPTSYTELSTTYTTNPYTGSPWTWAEIDALEVGVRQYDMGSGVVRTTQVYIVVDYGDFVEEELTADTWWLVENNSPDYSYSCFKDVTALVHANRPDGNATYAVGGVDGDTWTEWSYAGWSLIIIYSSPYEQGHQFFLWDQLMFAGTNAVGSFTIEGFQAPEDAEATLTCFVAEGDDFYNNDSLQFNDYYMSDEINPQNDVWNGKSSGLGGEIIDGVDIDTFDVSSPIVSPGDTSAEVAFTTAQDNWNLVYLILAFRSDLAVLTPSSAGILCYGLGGG